MTTEPRPPEVAKPRPPARLSAAGRHIWREVVGAYELRSDELLLLEKVCRTADEAARLDEAVRDAPLLVAGSTGQPRAHPVFHEARQTRALLAALLKQLGLPNDPAGDQAATRAEQRSNKAMKAARARWDKGSRYGT